MATKKQPEGPTVEEEQERALQWAVTQNAPLSFLQGWNPDSGDWADGSPVRDMLDDLLRRGGHLATTARRHDVRRITDLVSRGREYLAGDSEVPERREDIPIEVRPFVDLAQLVNKAESEVELTAVESLYEGAIDDAKVAALFLARRFPDRWREQSELHSLIETDPRELAMHELLSDPNAAVQVAAFARLVEKRGAEIESED
jgi:hypothetical protein